MRTHELTEIRLSSGEVLRGDFHSTDPADDRAIIFIHGFGSVRNGEKAVALEAACARGGLAFAAFDCRGHGQSDGQMRDLRPTRLLEDLAAVRDFLTGHGLRRLGLVGSSMGGFAGAWFAAGAAEVRACVLIAPAFRFLERRWESLSDLERDYWKKAGVVRYRNEHIDVEVGYGLMEERTLFPPGELAARWTKPALIFHGLRDDTVPVEDSLDFLRQAASPDVELRIFRDRDHRLTASKEEMASEAVRFLVRWL
jgi:pimeloyl-ACP methyl ester carboxylesterase